MSRYNIKLSVPEYFIKYINSSIDLNSTPKICCPFHKENTPSFSYNPSTGRWRCFGACKTGGNVIDLHRMNYKLRNNTEAYDSLCELLMIPKDRLNTLDEPIIVNEDNIELDRVYNLCLMHATNVERWLDLDYVMSIYPIDIIRLKGLLSKWGIHYD